MKIIEFAIRQQIEAHPVLVAWDIADISAIEQTSYCGFCYLIKKDGTRYFVKGSYRTILNRWIYVLEHKHYRFDDPVARPSVSLYHSSHKFEPDSINFDEDQLIEICQTLFPEKIEYYKNLWQMDYQNE